MLKNGVFGEIKWGKCCEIEENVVYLHPIESATPMRKYAYQGGTFFLYV